eukprot:CAMPEP_0117425762 /NCGR_PEP_ID=MMETSP0758-20121206/5998_1 /TAXON_ID=63605 /ORGANISM="Percolomonas cosmopolitus, Strain AE-1 (ATCC 50343)" /LENGTH=707 /DNA_ID=CAMNT_0005210499 /DNA_START=487 /DNA_END=2610 /DNA_ORIENTATION=-
MRKQVFPVAQKALTSPDTMKGALDNIPGVIPNISNVLTSFIDDVTEFKPIMDTIVNVSKTLVNDVNGVKPFLDRNAEILQDIQYTQTVMANQSAEANVSIPVFDFSAFTSVFGNSSQLLGFNISGTVDGILNTVNGSLANVQNSISGVRNTIDTQFDNIANMINGTLAPVKQQIEVLETTVIENAIFVQIFGEKNPDTNRYDKLDEYDQYSLYGEIGIAVAISLLLCVSAVIATFGFLCVCIAPKADKDDVEKQEKGRRCNCCCICCLCCYDCYAQTTLLFFAIISGFFLIIYFFSADVCSQAGTYPKKTEESLNLPNLTLPASLSSKVNVTIPQISFADAFTGFLQCPSDADILQATGLNFKTFGVVDTIKNMANSALGNLNTFNVSALTENALSSVNSLNSSIALPDTATFTRQLTNLTDNMENLLYTFYNAFPLLLVKSDFDTETEQFVQLNDILVKYNIPNATQENIYNYAPEYYDVTGFRGEDGQKPVPGKLTAQGGNSPEFSWVMGNVTVTERNLIYGNRARQQPATVIAPGIVNLGLVFNLTRLNAKSPWQVKFQLDNLGKIKGNITLLGDNIEASKDYIVGILNLKSRFSPVVDQIVAKFDGVIAAIPNLIENVVGVLDNALANEPALKCGFIGTFYNETTSSYCGNILLSMGGTSITILCSMFVFFFATIIIYWSWFLHEKLVYGEEGDDFYDDGELD